VLNGPIIEKTGVVEPKSETCDKSSVPSKILTTAKLPE